MSLHLRVKKFNKCRDVFFFFLSKCGTHSDLCIQALAVKNHRVLLWPGLNHFRLATSLRQALHLGDIMRGHAWGGRKKRFQSFVIRLRVLAHGSRTRNGEPARRLLKQPAYYFTSFFTGSFPKMDLFSLFLAPSDSHIWREKCFHHENVAIVKTSK